MPRIITIADYVAAEPGFVPPLINSVINPNTTVTIKGVPVVVQGATFLLHTNFSRVVPIVHVPIVIPGSVPSRVTINNIPVAIETDFLAAPEIPPCVVPLTPVVAGPQVVPTVFAGPGV